MMKNWTFWKDGNESEKKTVTLPHDAMLLEKREPDMENGAASGFFPGGKYVYEKVIPGTSDLAGKKILIEFEGVYMNSDVTLNGERVGGHVYGYTNFYCDITDKIKIGEDNTLRVVADNSKTPNSRWYSGSGIYRPVNMWVGEIGSIMPESVRVTTKSTNPAVVKVEITGEKNPNQYYDLQILKDGKEILRELLKPGESVKEIQIPDALLWNTDTPNLYTLITKLMDGDEVVDADETRFGIRDIKWNAKQGFMVNGKTVKLYGGCIHHGHGILGAAAYDKSEYRRIKKLKELGFNAIRYSHNPAGKNFLDACDELGMYVVDESFDQWKMPQNTYDYATVFDSEWEGEVEALVSKDYNHPCVIMYGIGNEITDVGLPFGAGLAKMINAKFHKLDSSRPTMLANNHMLTVLADMKAKQAAAAKDKPQGEQEITGSTEVNNIVALLPKIMAETKPEQLEAIAKESFEAVDICGYNYGFPLYKGTHELAPNRVILSSETFPKRMAMNWKFVNGCDYIIGDFLWTAWDYLGEAGCGLVTYGSDQAPFSKTYPCQTAACGSVDLTGFPEAQAIYNAVLWGAYKKPYIAVRPVEHSGEPYTLGNWRFTDAIPSWDFAGYEGRDAEIEVYSVGDSVELFKDGVLVGKNKLEDCLAHFTVPYSRGTLEAVSFNTSGGEIGRVTLATTGDETHLAVLPEETKLAADGEDIVYVPVHVVDNSGALKMTTDIKISVEVDGPAKLIALGSARCETTEDYHAGSFTSYHGRVLAIIQSTGERGDVKVKASADGLEAASAEVYAG